MSTTSALVKGGTGGPGSALGQTRDGVTEEQKAGGSIADDGTPHLLKIIDLVRPHWKPLTVAMIAVIAQIVAGILEPWPVKLVVDNILQAKPPGTWLSSMATRVFGSNELAMVNFAVAAVAVIAIVGAIGAYWQKYLTTSVSQWVGHDLRLTLYSHIQRLSLAQNNEARTGDLITRVTSDIGAIQDFISTVLLGLFLNILTLVGMIGIMLYLDWRFTLIALSVAPLLAGVVYHYTRRIKKASRAVRKQEGELVSIVQEVLTSMQVVQAFAREEHEERRFANESMDNVEAGLEARALKARLAPLVEVIVAAGTCLVLWYGARLAIAGQLTAGVLIVFLLYLGKMYKPLRDLSKMTDTVSRATVGYERIQEVLMVESRVRDTPHARRAPAFKGKIEFHDVHFGYEGQSNEAVLTGVNLTVEPGQVAAIAGPSGSGKSTLVEMIARFQDPVSGYVAIDGTDIRQYQLKSLRDQISFVLQDTLLFQAKVWENIAYGKPTATAAEIRRAAELANAHEFIMAMPEGYDTVVGERGVTLSGGERQRIAIARAVIRDTPILILDEPTVGLDAASEQAVVDALARLMKGRTSIVIAHNLAAIRTADIIFVIDQASVVEQGTHDELLKKNGTYADLFKIEATKNAKPSADQPAT